MRWSQAYIPTLRDDPADAEAPSHKLLVRGGFIRQLMAGHYSLLPLGQRVRLKVMQIIREEMDAIGGQECLLPAMHPAEIWRATGRWDIVGDELFRLQDRREADLVLGFTHEEIFATLATELTSYRQLPQIWYQIQVKFRDEPRPKSGLLRVREFSMKDSYSFDLDAAGLDRAFEAHRHAYRNIFARLDLDTLEVAASSGAMGGSDSVEFMVPTDAGEDDVLHCPHCGYSANQEKSDSRLEPIDDGEGLTVPEEFPTPGIRTIQALAEMEGGAAPERQIKTLVYVIDGELVLVLLRGDHALVEQKLRDITGATDLRPAHSEEVREAMGADPGSLGAVGVTDQRVIADEALTGRTAMTTGANVDDRHLRGVDVDRDISVSQWANLRHVTGGEPCVECGTPLEEFRAIEVAHIFKLGTKYSVDLGVGVLDENGKTQVPIMGSYGIGVERNMAAVVETHRDEHGIVWPLSIAPYAVVVTVLKMDDEATVAAGEQLYDELRAAGVEVLLDDRNERPGVKFKDAELIGIPFRVTVGPRGLADGKVEFTYRSSLETVPVALDEVVGKVVDLLP